MKRDIYIISNSVEKDLYFHYMTAEICDVCKGDTFEYKGDEYRLESIIGIYGGKLSFIAEKLKRSKFL